jgi:hypothetical protein
MNVRFERTTLVVERAPGDPRMRGGSWGSAESQLLYHIKKYLNRHGFDLVKKRMWRDGHLVSDDQLYLRSRNLKAGDFAIWNGSYAIYDSGERFMRDGRVVLNVERGIWRNNENSY